MRPMTDAEKLEALARYARCVVRSVKVVNGMARGTEAAAAAQELHALRIVAREMLGREATEEELRFIGS